MVPTEEMRRIQVDLEILALLKMHIARLAIEMFSVLRIVRLELRPGGEVNGMLIAEPMLSRHFTMLVHLVGRHVFAAALAEWHRSSSFSNLVLLDKLVFNARYSPHVVDNGGGGQPWREALRTSETVAATRTGYLD